MTTGFWGMELFTGSQTRRDLEKRCAAKELDNDGIRQRLGDARADYLAGRNGMPAVSRVGTSVPRAKRGIASNEFAQRTLPGRL